MIIIAFLNDVDGRILRWYRDIQAASIGDESMSVTRAGVKLYHYLHSVPEDQIELARAAHQYLRQGHDVVRLATHRYIRNREIAPVIATNHTPAAAFAVTP